MWLSDTFQGGSRLKADLEIFHHPSPHAPFPASFICSYVYPPLCFSTVALLNRKDDTSLSNLDGEKCRNPHRVGYKITLFEKHGLQRC